MNFIISAHNVEVTPSMRGYTLNKLDRVTRHFNEVVRVCVQFTFNPHKDKEHRNTVAIDLHVKGRDFHVEHTNGDMYDVMEMVVRALDRKIVEHRKKLKRHRRENSYNKRVFAAAIFA